MSHPANESCRTCRYFGGDQSRVGMCLRYPPRSVPGEPVEPAPGVYGSGWCGEWSGDASVAERASRAAAEVVADLTVEAALRNLVRDVRHYLGDTPGRHQDFFPHLAPAESLLQSRDGVGATQEMAPDGTVTK